MSRRIKHSWIAIVSVVGFLPACNQVSFSIQGTAETISRITPIGPPQSPAPAQPIVSSPIDSPPVDFEPNKKTVGTCKDQEVIGPCMKCEVSTKPPEERIWTKSERLMEIMHASCQIKNKSDPKEYDESKFPKREELVQRLESCINDVYPETPMSEEQKNTIDALLSEDDSMRQKINGGLWHKPPYTDHFELYFGISNFEARRLFCYKNWRVQGFLITSEYAQKCMHSRDYPHCADWKNDKAAQRRWNEVQNIRKLLSQCMDLPNPNPPEPTPNEPTKECTYQTFEGVADEEARSFYTVLKSLGYRLSIESLGQAPSCVSADSLPENFNDLEKVRIVGTLCP
jgi:hypothetical protein